MRPSTTMYCKGSYQRSTHRFLDRLECGSCGRWSHFIEEETEDKLQRKRLMAHYPKAAS